MTYKKMKDD
jgi:hypothetical protein